MNKKLMVGMLIPLMIMIVAVYGYAQFTSTITETVTASAGTFYIEFTSAAYTSEPSYTTTTFSSVPTQALTVTTGPLAPGDTVTIQFQISNTGNLPGTLIEGIGLTTPFTYSDTCPGTIGALATVTVTANIVLPAGYTGPQGVSVTFTVTITGTAT
jgi:hypothetical protein